MGTVVREHPKSLPPWGRCPNAHSAAGADEVTAVQIRWSAIVEAAWYRTSPGPYGATLPFGEGIKRCLHNNDAVIFIGSFFRFYHFYNKKPAYPFG
jgi:hypothetical protein